MFDSRKTAPTGEATEPARDAVRMRFLTAGGAVVELRSRRFDTRYYTSRGRGYVDGTDRWREVDGYTWGCLGCGLVGKVAYDDTEYLPGELNLAREHANAHAGQCRALPRSERP
jgi:hypothetical protein